MRVVLSVALSALALALAACGNESDATFDHEGFPFTFKYPPAFAEVSDVNFDTSLSASAAQNAAIGIGDNDLVLVQRFNLNVPVDRSNLGAARRQFDNLFRQLDPTVDAQASDVAGRPTLTIDAVDIASVPDGQSRFVAFFDGDQEYLLNCQSTPDNRADIEQACDMALETLSFDGSA